MSHLHNNDAMLGVKTCRAARTCCAGRALALSQCAGPGRPGGMACRGWPAGCMLGDGTRDSASFDPQHAGASFCDVICIRSIGQINSERYLHSSKSINLVPFWFSTDVFPPYPSGNITQCPVLAMSGHILI